MTMAAFYLYDHARIIILMHREPTSVLTWNDAPLKNEPVPLISVKGLPSVTQREISETA
jgi:hypothetical protein